MKLRLFRSILPAMLLVVLGGCAWFDPVLTDARKLFEEGRGEESLALLDKTSKKKPDQYGYRTEYFRQRDLLVARWFAQADTLQASGQYDAAAERYRLVQRYDPENARARAGLAQIDTETRHRVLVTRAQALVRQHKYTEADDVLRPVLVENPQHRDARRLQRSIEEKTMKPAITTPQLIAAASKPLTLELRDVPLRAVFDVISRGIGVNFVFDKDVRADQRTSLAIQDAPAEEVIRLVLVTNQLEKKIVNERTVLVFPNTPQKLREYQELVVRSFYLANADVKQAANMIRTLVKTRDLFVDEKLNLLIIKDTANAVRLAERLIAAQDLAEPEVMLEVEVLEVGTNRLLELGLRFPDSLAVSLVGAGTSTTTGTGTGGGTTTTTTTGTPGTITLAEWLNRNSSMVSLTFTNPLFLLTLRQQDGSTSVLANPRIRVRNKTKARIHIGDRVPVITTTAAAVGGFISESVTYLDVGLKLEVEPLVHLEDEVDINIGLEVSNIAREVRSATSNTLTYQIGTRNAATALRLRDGETQVLAGLISDEDRRAANRVPGLGNLAVVGRLFSATHDTTAKTEIVLLITPRLVRTLARPEARSLEFAAGTEASTGGSGAVGFAPPSAYPEPAPGPVTPPSGFQPPVSPAPTTAPPNVPAPLTPSAPGLGPMVPFGGVQRESAR